MMFTHLSTIIVLLTARISAQQYGGAPAQNGDQTTCLTQFRSGNGYGRPQPVQTRFSTCTETITSTSSITLEPIIPSSYAAPPPSMVNPFEPICVSTITVSADPTTTIYTGTLNEAAPTPHFNQAMRLAVVAPFAPIRHYYGQPFDFGGQRPFLVDCTVHHTITAYTSTTITKSYREYLTTPILIASSAMAGPASSGEICTSTTGTASATTTQDIMCAPTNLITTVNGAGIAEIRGYHFALAFASDPSVCCQMCKDSIACAASETDLTANNCFLWYANITCGIGLSISDGKSNLAAAGTSFAVQTGCGTIGVF